MCKHTSEQILDIPLQVNAALNDQVKWHTPLPQCLVGGWEHCEVMRAAPFNDDDV